MTFLDPTRARMSSTCSSMTDSFVQSAVRPATLNRKFSRIFCPFSEWRTSGCHCTPANFFAAHSKAATGVSGVEARTSKPAGASATESPWDIQTL